MTRYEKMFITVLILSVLAACVSFPQTAISTETSEEKSAPPATETRSPLGIQEIQAGETTTSEPSATATIETTPTVNLPPIIDATNYDKLIEIGKIVQEYPQKIYWTDNNQNFVIQSQNKVVLYDSSNLVSLATFVALDGTMLLDFSPTEKLIAVTSDQQTIEMWDLLSKEKVYSFRAPSMFTGAYFSPDGKLVIDSIDEIVVYFLNPHDGKILNSYRGFQTAAPVYTTDISKDNTRLIWIARGTMQITDMITDQLGPVFSHEDFISSYALSPDGAILVTSAGGTLNNTFQTILTFWNTTDGSVNNQIATTEMASGLDFSAQGDIISGGVGKTVVLWNTANPEKNIVIEGFTDNVNYTAFSLDGRMFAATSFDNTVRIWQVNQ